MKTTLLSTVAALALVSSAALADGFTDPAVESSVLTFSQDSSWTGFYAGGAFGGVDTDLAVNNEGYAYGVFGGYRYDLGSVVLGGEVGYTWAEGATDFGTVEAQLGYNARNFLPYLSVGYAWDSASNEGLVYGLGLDYAIAGTNAFVGAKLVHQDFANNANVLSLRVGLNF